ncbi:MAG: hypothetical protein ACR2QM_05765, partial [Longimicrobiales bacterium]
MSSSSHPLLGRVHSAAVAVMVFASVFAFSEVASAQTAQPWSIQASGLVHGFDDDRTGVGPGVEVQVRRNLSAFSFGVGADHTWNSGDIDTIATISVSVLSLFVEPRYVIDVGRDR